MIHLLVALCLVAGSCGMFYWWPRRRMWALAKKVPGPPCYPIVGCLSLLMIHLKEYIPTIAKFFDDYGSVVRLWIGPEVRFFIKDPEDIQQVLSNPRIRNRDYRVTRAFSTCTGESLATLRGDQWKSRRKLISQTFHFNVLEDYVNIFERKSIILMEQLKQFEGKYFNVYDILALCTLDSICETTMGTSSNFLASGSSPIADCLHEAQQLIFKRATVPWQMSDYLYSFTSDSRQAKRVKQTLNEFGKEVVARKLAEYRRGVTKAADGKTLSSFLDLLIAASEAEGSVLSAADMGEEVTFMALAGMETSATAMAFFLTLLALHPQIQAELHEELDKVFGGDSRRVTSQDLQDLCVLERCVKETLRMFPIVSLITREADEDVKLPSGYVLPANSYIVICCILTQRDGRNFPEPDQFRPDRWLPENSVKTHPYAYLPFGAGARNCVGQKYAKLQMKTVLSHILRRYRVTTFHTLQDLDKLDSSVTLTMSTAMKYRFHIQLHRR